MPIDAIPFSLTEGLISVIWLGLSAGLLGWFVRDRGRLWLPIAVGFVLRVFVAVLHRLTGMNPEGHADAVAMENRAWFWAQEGCLSLGAYFDPAQSYVHSWLIANVYACAERAPLFFQLSNVTLGMVAVIFVAKTADRMWSAEAALKAAWIGALFPAWIVYSTVPMREAWIYATLSVGMYFLVRWAVERRITTLLTAAVWLALPVLFHGGMAMGFIAAAMFVTLLVSLQVLRIVVTGWAESRTLSALVVVLLFCAVGVSIAADLRFSSVANLMEEGLELHLIAEMIDARATGDLAYADPPRVSSLRDLLASAPRQSARLLFGPFPWEVRTANMAALMLEALIYVAFVLPILFHFRAYFARIEVWVLIVVLVALVLIFGFGTVNYGTSLRHRAKFAGILVVLFSGAGHIRAALAYGRRGVANTR